MKKLLIFGFLLIMSLFINSCRKEETLREKLAGPKTMSLYQWIKMDDKGEFSIVIHDTTNLVDLILWNNNNASLNNVTYLGDLAPSGWKYANVGVGEPYRLPIGWYTDYEENSSFTFWSIDKTSTRYRVTYAMTKKLNGTIHLETVYNTTDGIFKEVLELKNKK
jgi:hypothetical protein